MRPTLSFGFALVLLGGLIPCDRSRTSDPKQSLSAPKVPLPQCEQQQGEPPPQQVDPIAKVPQKFDSYGDSLPQFAVGRLGTVRFRHADWVSAVRYSPEGRSIFAGDRAGYICMWEAETGKERWSARPYRTVDCLAYSSTGKIVASAGSVAEGSLVILWDAATGREISRPVQTAKERVGAIAFSPDSKLLAVAVPNEHTIRVLDTASGKLLCQVESFSTDPDGISFSPDSSLLAGPDLKGTVHLWQSTTGKQILELDELPSRGGPIRFSPDGASLAIRDLAGIGFIAVADGKKMEAQFRTNSSGPIAYTHDGKMLLVGEAYSIRLLDVAACKEVRRLCRTPGSVLSLSLSPNGKTLAVGTTVGAVRLVDVATGDDAFPHELGTQVIRSASFSPDGNSVATTTSIAGVVVWDIGGKKPRWAVQEGEGQYTPSIAFSPNGRSLAVGARGSIRIRDSETGRLVLDVKSHEGSAVCVAFSPDGQSIACADHSSTVPISDVETGRVRFRISSADRWMGRVLFTADGRFLATGSNDGSLALWDATNGEPWRSFLIQQDGILALAASPDGAMLASSGRSGPVLVRELATGGERVRLDPGAHSITALAFAPNGRIVAAGNSEGIVRLYDLAEGKELCKLDGHRGSVDSLEFSSDGRLLLSKSADTTALLWEMSGLRRVVGARTEGNITAKQLDTLWADLGHTDAAKAYKAIYRLAESKEAGPFIREHLIGISKVHAQRREQIPQSIASLGSEVFAEREKATEYLTTIREDADLWLRRAAVNPSPEVSRRASGILRGMRGASPMPEELRVLRSIEVLELMATPQAQEVLRSLADGMPEFRLTQASGAALRRMSVPRGEKK